MSTDILKGPVDLPEFTLEISSSISLEVVGRIKKLQWATKVLRHLVVKLDFWAFSSHFPPFPPKNNVDFSISSTTQTTAPKGTQH